MKIQPGARDEIGRDERVPASLAPCFQEYEVAGLDMLHDRDLIIERVLAYGNPTDRCPRPASSRACKWHRYATSAS